MGKGPGQGIAGRIARRLKGRQSLLIGLALAGTYAAALALDRKAGQTGRLPAVAKRPNREGFAFWKHVLIRTYHEINDDRLLALGAGVVFYGLLAIFPAVTALVSSYALFAKPVTIGSHLSQLALVMPPSAYSIVDEQVTRIVTRTTGDLGLAFFFGLALAIWSANAGAKAIIDALNIVYGVKERRSFVRLNLVSLGLTLLALLALLLAIGAVVVLPVVLSYLPFYGYEAAVLPWLRWPALFAGALLALAVLYRFGPNRSHARWQFVSAGAVFATLAWLCGSSALSWYLGSFANYDATYGSLGAGIGLMMWLWMTAIVVLIGAELNSEIDNAMRPGPEPEESGIGKPS